MDAKIVLVPTFWCGFFLGLAVATVFDGHPIMGILLGFVAFCCAWQD
jgi:hypothetical protein